MHSELQRLLSSRSTPRSHAAGVHAWAPCEARVSRPPSSIILPFVPCHSRSFLAGPCGAGGLCGACLLPASAHPSLLASAPFCETVRAAAETAALSPAALLPGCCGAAGAGR